MEKAVISRAAAQEILEIEGDVVPGNNPAIIQAAFSGGSGVAIFAGLVNTPLTQPFLSGVDTTAGWVSEREVQNFRTQQRTRIQHSEKLAQLTVGANAEHVSVRVVVSEEYRAHRFAKQFVVDEQDLIDDDVDALVQPGLALGRAAIRLKLDLIFSILLANANLSDTVVLFHTDHNNLNTSAALATATLDSAIAGCKVQQENGADLGLVVSHIVVPPELEGLAKRLVRAMETRSGQSIRVHGEPRLSNGVTDPISNILYAGSTSDWFTSASSASAPMVEFGYIGQNSPSLTAWKTEEGEWGAGYSLTWSIGAKALDFWGMSKNEA